MMNMEGSFSLIHAKKVYLTLNRTFADFVAKLQQINKNATKIRKVISLNFVLKN